MRVAGVAINAAMLAALVGVEAPFHGDIGALDFIEDGFGVCFEVFGGQIGRFPVGFHQRPIDRLGVGYVFFKPRDRIDLGASPFEKGLALRVICFFFRHEAGCFVLQIKHFDLIFTTKNFKIPPVFDWTSPFSCY